ncbi:MAG: YtxH domain-containing protein [Candidatus Saccharibacteria bacterium]|nr:YtxH domain-containing protein [Candidatus Saccharibacteria bacterium]
MAKKRGSNLALGAVVAAGAGYVAGLLTAPKSGKETRKDVKNAANKARAESEKKLKEAYGELSKLVTRAKQKSTLTTDKAKSEVNKAVERAQAAMDKTGVLLSAVREGETDDKELQKAIKEAKDAAKHLKTYLSSDDSKNTEK